MRHLLAAVIIVVLVHCCCVHCCCCPFPPSLPFPLQECVLAAGPDEVLPKPDLLVLTLNEPAVQAIRRAKTEQQAAAAQEHKQQQHGAGAGAGGVTRTTSSISGGGGSSVVPRYDVRATGGLALCSKEWLGLELQHAGSWQLSLLYNGEQLKTFSKVRWCCWCCGCCGCC